MTHETPPVVCIIGRKNAGKTDLTVALGAELNRRGLRVMTAKHGHGFQLDQPGRDSWRHRHEGGAFRTVMAGPADFAVVGSWPGEEMPLSQLVDRFLEDADFVLAEGFKSSPEPKVEVFRGLPGTDPLYDPADPRSSRTIAMVTDCEDLGLSIPVFRPSDPAFPANLVDFLLDHLLGDGGPS